MPTVQCPKCYRRLWFSDDKKFMQKRCQCGRWVYIERKKD